jgi:hypothetical protein
MDKAWLFIWLLMGHFIFDWLLQTYWMSINKSKHWFPLTLHSGIYALGVYFTGWLALGMLPSWHILILLFISHYLLDDYRFHIWWLTYIKRMPAEKARETLWMIVCIDQIWHILILFGLIYLV